MSPIRLARGILFLLFLVLRRFTARLSISMALFVLAFVDQLIVAEHLSDDLLGPRFRLLLKPAHVVLLFRDGFHEEAASKRKPFALRSLRCGTSSSTNLASSLSFQPVGTGHGTISWKRKAKMEVVHG